MNNTKSILLFLTLIFPVLIYLFLQGFGKNEFDIPIYYQNGVEYSSAGCLPHSQVPYHLDKSELDDVFGNQEYDKIIVYDLGNVDSDQLRNNLYTFLEKYKDRTEVQLITVRPLEDSIFKPSRYSSWKRYNLPDSQLMRLGRCILQLELNDQMKSDSGLVLVDRMQRIRGYYDPQELKEIDRLNTEVFILLSK